jgi:uncharacterized protein
MTDANHKTALVTGAASGFGFEFSKLLASDSYNLILVDYNEPELDKAKELLSNNYPVMVESIVFDLSLPQAAACIYEKTKGKQVDVLINNAGFGLFGYFNQTDWQTEEAMINLQVTTLTHLTKLFLTNMVARHSGRIMNVSSVAAFQPGPLMAIYYATKSYILSFSQAIANEIKGTGVTVTVFCPGQTKTRFQENVALKSHSEISKSHWIADAAKVAAIGYQAMKTGKTLSVPRFGNKLIVQLNRLLPRKTAISFVRILQESIRK